MPEYNDLPREFEWCSTRLADPDPGLSAIQVRDLYAGSYPEMTNATVGQAVEKDGKRVITFAKGKVATKG